jgi:putative drug exporter of the RND superfamily
VTAVENRTAGDSPGSQSISQAEDPLAPPEAAASPAPARWADAGRFSRLGDFVVGRPLLIIGFWVVAAVLSMLTLPSLASIGNTNPPAGLPSDAPSRVTAQAMAKAFGESASQNLLLVVLTDNNGLNPGDEAAYRRVVDTLREDKDNVVALQDFVATPGMRGLMTSADDKAWIVPVSLAGDLGTPRADGAYKQVVPAVKAALKKGGADTSLAVDFAGPAATAAGLSTVSGPELPLIAIMTAVAVLAVLLIIYRNVVIALLSLATIGVAVVVAQRTAAVLALLGLAVSNWTTVLITAVLLGAGTGYAVLLISRYHEFVRAGSPSDDAVRRALATTGKVLAASAGALGGMFLAMSFARLGVFSTAGPALAATVAVGFLAAVTLLPALLCLAGNSGLVAPGRDLTARLWRRWAIYVVRRPVRHLALSAIVLTALAACTAFMRLDHDDRNMLPAAFESSRGYAAMDEHFPANSTIPQYLLVQSPHDLRTPQSLADLELMVQRVSQVRDVSAVRGLTRPTGQPIEQAKVSYQAGQVGTELSGAASHIANDDGHLNALTQGSRVLADTLASLSVAADQNLGVVKSLVDAAADLMQQLDAQKTLELIDSGLSVAKNLHLIGAMMGVSLDDQQNFFDVVGPVVDGLNASPVCNLNASCAATRGYLQHLVQARDDGTFDAFKDLGHKLQTVQGDSNIGDAVHNLRAFLRSAINALNSMGIHGTSTLRKQIDDWLVGAHGLAQGSRQLAGEVQALVDQTRQMGAGLNQAGAILSRIKNSAAQSSMAGFFIPQQALASPDFKNIAAMTVSQDGHVVRYLVQSKLNPSGTEALNQVDAIQNAARSAQPNTSLSDATISLSGIPVANRDLRTYADHDFRYMGIVTIVVVLAVLMLLLRAVVAPLYLLGSAIVAYLAALGTGGVVFQVLLHQPISWSVPGTAFLVLVAVGSMHNLLLMSRVRDESPNAIRLGVIRAGTATGEAITGAGIAFAVTMLALSLSSMTAVAQLGFIVGVGLLLNTLVLRTVTLPAVVVLTRNVGWWPSGAVATVRRKRARREAVTVAVYRGDLWSSRQIRPVFSRWSRRTSYL